MKILLLLNIYNVSLFFFPFAGTVVINNIFYFVAVAIDKAETTVKVTPPSLNINGHVNQSITSRPDISKMWRYSVFHVSYHFIFNKKRNRTHLTRIII